MAERPTQAELLAIDSPHLFQAAVEKAAGLLAAGQVVALPTETVYGLAANALNPEAVSRIFEIKGRPASNPIIVHVASLDLAKRCVRTWPLLAEKLAKGFWPGPLTLVLPRHQVIPDIVTAGGPTVAVRWPSHPLIQAVIRHCGFPLAAPSANPFGGISPTTAAHVAGYFGARIPLIVDGGPAHVGIESTVLDISVSPPRLLRPGMIHESALAAVIGPLIAGAGPETVLRSPGQLPRHYSPKAKLVLAAWKNESELMELCARHRVPAGKLDRQLKGEPLNERIHVIAHTHIPFGIGHVSVIPHDPEAFARALYGELHRCDQAGARLILVEDLPDTVEWRAIRDRLKRAAAE